VFRFRKPSIESIYPHQETLSTMAAAHSPALSQDGSPDVRVFGAKAHDSRTAGTAVTPAGVRVVRPVLETNQIHEADNTGATGADDRRVKAIAGRWGARKDCEGAQVGLIKSITFGVRM
jgi:hypothetical protein